MKNAGDSPARFDGLYRALISLSTHHDRMRWSRIQLLVAVQGAIIGGAYALGNHYLSGLVLAAGAFLSLGILVLVTKDERDRDANTDIINDLGHLLLPESITTRLEESSRSRPFIKLRAEPPVGRSLARGKLLVRFIIWILIGIDLLLVALHCLGIAPVLGKSP